MDCKQCLLGLLTNWVDVKEAHVCPQYGVEHAVVECLSTSHQNVEKHKTPHKAKHESGSNQT